MRRRRRAKPAGQLGEHQLRKILYATPASRWHSTARWPWTDTSYHVPSPPKVGQSRCSCTPAPRPYAHLREEFETRLAVIREAGDTPDPRDAQINRLKAEIAALKDRLAHQGQTVEELTDFRKEALSRLAAQHEEILQLRRQHDRDTGVRRLPARTTGIGPCS
ncbi:hypothetical protein GCM10022224_063500 [Nonomuraea antimicrobica]|uniref:Uncharacterized protein n=1 Tax=Nonomuraea antimicrobica TaxID=561173 RepID=A0ABP7CJG3_9ACTN